MNTKLLINGQWTDGDSTRSLRRFAPATGEPLGAVQFASDEQVSQAVAAAQSAQLEWAQTPVTDRARILSRLADLLEREYGVEGEPTELKQLISLEVGKLPPEADIEVIESADIVRCLAESAANATASVELSLNKELWPTKRSSVVKEPLGVVAVIKAWNYPLEVPLWGIASALLAGNTVVFKPSEHSALVGVRLAELVHEAGLPDGVLNLVIGDGKVGGALVDHPSVNAVSFTGSYAVGEQIGAECARSGKKAILELSGNDAAIVLPDANIELAANGIVWGAFCNAGQVCVGVKRALVHSSVAEEFTRACIELVASLRLGTDVGPLVSEQQLAKVERQVATLSVEAEIVIGGNRRAGGGYFFEPTVVKGITSDSLVFREEVFGPVLPITVFNEISAAVEFANSSEFGLGASVWTQSADSFRDVARSLEAGMVWHNDVNLAFPEAPWGGVKKSGYGTDLSRWSFDDYTYRKHICIEEGSEPTRAWWYPYS